MAPPSPSSPALLLASRSPRRAQLLEEAGFHFRQVSPGWQDPASPETGATARAQAVALAGRKARATPRPEEAVLLAADTLIALEDGTLAGTPESASAAGAILRRLAGRTHEVVTGLALLGPQDETPECHVASAEVSLGELGPEAIQTYLQSGLWRGKAGGYNILERRAAGWPIDVRGEITTVMGLPMPVLVPRLADRGIRPAAEAP